MQRLPSVDHGAPLVAVVERGTIFGVQFHPEKSGESGAAVLSNFPEHRQRPAGGRGSLMGLACRLIPCLDTDGERVVKGVRFQNLRDAGDPAELAARYDHEGADELVVLDIAASRTTGLPFFLQLNAWRSSSRSRSRQAGA